MTDLENAVLAYYVAGQAKELTVAPRWYPHGELILIIDDKMQVAVRKFGRKVRGATRAAATAFLDHMIANGGWSSTKNDFGGSMHQYQSDTYPRVLAELRAGNPLIQEAEAAGDDFWETRFAQLAG